MILTSQRRKRDTTGLVGTGLGILNSIDSEVLANKLSTIMEDLSRIQHPLRSSLLAVGNNQYLVSDILPQWERLNEKSLRSTSYNKTVSVKYFAKTLEEGNFIAKGFANKEGKGGT